MIRPGSFHYAWASDPEIQSRGTNGGLVTGLLIYLLASGKVEAVATIRQGADLYDAELAITSDEREILSCSRTLYCGTLLTAKLLARYLEGNAGQKLAVVLKGCDVKALIELSKRNKFDIDDLFLIGVNCSGTISPIQARRMITEKYHADPDDVDDISFLKGQCIVRHNGTTAGIPIDELEEEGYGRRLCCQRCLTRIPRQADIVCGSWGVIGTYTGNATFVEVCNRKGADILQEAVRSGYIGIQPADPKGVDIRSRVEDAMMTLSRHNRNNQFMQVGSGDRLLSRMMMDMSRCIKCYQCSEACPLCICDDCQTKKPWLVKPGQIPPPFMFHLIRVSHIADSCVNCGQCEDRCPMEIPNSLFMNVLQGELEVMFGYHAGERSGRPVVAKVNELEEWEHYYGDNAGRLIDIFKE